MPPDGSRTTAAQVQALAPPVLVLGLAAAYLGTDALAALPETVAAAVPTSVVTTLVAAQGLALVLRHRRPAAVFALVVLLDAALLLASGGVVGTGGPAVMVATYAVLRRDVPRTRYLVVGAGAVVTLVVGAVAMATAGSGTTGSFSILVVLVVAVARPVVQYGVPAVLAESFLSRARLVQALQDRADLAEQARLHDVEREIGEVRAAMARELHDIAAHHLSGIIVGAQAASALVTADPERSREMLRTVQQDARTTLVDLRRTVGLLRSDEPGTPGSTVRPAPVPSIGRIASLVHAAQGRGQLVESRVDGDPRLLGPLAETAGYRMAQESLANAARHAPGAPVRVLVEYLEDVVRITVHNDAPVEPTAVAHTSEVEGGHGISGMQERADLVGGRLVTARLPDGAWRNVLEIPTEKNRSAT